MLQEEEWSGMAAQAQPACSFLRELHATEEQAGCSNWQQQEQQAAAPEQQAGCSNWQEQEALAEQQAIAREGTDSHEVRLAPPMKCAWLIPLGVAPLTALIGLLFLPAGGPGSSCNRCRCTRGW